jgi:hypothetical protein
MNSQRFAVVIISALALGVSNSALAYVGPGAGLSLLGALWGLLIAVGAALGYVLLWPLRRMRKRRQTAAEAGSNANAQTSTASGGTDAAAHSANRNDAS